MENKVWFVTGASKGLGLSFIKKLLAKGYKVAATSRNLSELKKAVDSKDKNFLPLEVDIMNEKSVSEALQQTKKQFGSIDVLVNNAGYGLIGALEELSDKEARQNFDVNVFGSLNVIRQVLPFMRSQQSGHIFNISSIGGFAGAFPGFGIYCATKFAVQGFSEALLQEVKPFGINVTVVYPGYFRTNFLEDNSLSVASTTMNEYANVRETQAAHQNSINGQQPGDPDKAVDVMIDLSEQKNPPLHAFLGADAYATAALKIESVQKDMDQIRDKATATGFTIEAV